MIDADGWTVTSLREMAAIHAALTAEYLNAADLLERATADQTAADEARAKLDRVEYRDGF